MLSCSACTFRALFARKKTNQSFNDPRHLLWGHVNPEGQGYHAPNEVLGRQQAGSGVISEARMPVARIAPPFPGANTHALKEGNEMISARLPQSHVKRSRRVMLVGKMDKVEQALAENLLAIFCRPINQLLSRRIPLSSAASPTAAEYSLSLAFAP
jgi:hypothetical protein